MRWPSSSAQALKERERKTCGVCGWEHSGSLGPRAREDLERVRSESMGAGSRRDAVDKDMCARACLQARKAFEGPREQGGVDAVFRCECFDVVMNDVVPHDGNVHVLVAAWAAAQQGRAGALLWVRERFRVGGKVGIRRYKPSLGALGEASFRAPT